MYIIIPQRLGRVHDIAPDAAHTVPGCRLDSDLQWWTHVRFRPIFSLSFARVEIGCCVLQCDMCVPDKRKPLGAGLGAPVEARLEVFFKCHALNSKFFPSRSLCFQPSAHCHRPLSVIICGPQSRFKYTKNFLFWSNEKYAIFSAYL